MKIQNIHHTVQKLNKANKYTSKTVSENFKDEKDYCHKKTFAALPSKISVILS